MFGASAPIRDQKRLCNTVDFTAAEDPVLRMDTTQGSCDLLHRVEAFESKRMTVPPTIASGTRHLTGGRLANTDNLAFKEPE